MEKSPQPQIKEEPIKDWKPSPELQKAFEEYWKKKFVFNDKARRIIFRFPFVRTMVEDAYFTAASVIVKGKHVCQVCFQNTDLTEEEQEAKASNVWRRGL